MSGTDQEAPVGRERAFGGIEGGVTSGSAAQQAVEQIMSRVQEHQVTRDEVEANSGPRPPVLARGWVMMALLGVFVTVNVWNVLQFGGPPPPQTQQESEEFVVLQSTVTALQVESHRARTGLPPSTLDELGPMPVGVTYRREGSDYSVTAGSEGVTARYESGTPVGAGLRKRSVRPGAREAS